MDMVIWTQTPSSEQCYNTEIVKIKIKLSPAMCVFGRPTKDFIHKLPGRYRPHPAWEETLSTIEDALRKRHLRAMERWSEHTKQLPPLAVSDHVHIQNQVGRNPRKWDKTGIVIEVRQHNQYVVRVDGSGRVTLRNRKFLRKYIPVHSPRCLNNPKRIVISSAKQPMLQHNTNGNVYPPDVTVNDPPVNTTPQQSDLLPETDIPDSSTEPEIAASPTKACEPQSQRQSSRIRQPPKWQTSGEFDMTNSIYGAE